MTNAASFFQWPEPRGGGAPHVSVVVPMFDEEGSAGLLIDEINAALADFDAEIIAVDDASTDLTLAELAGRKAAAPRLRVIRHQKNAGQSRAIRSGILAARGDVIVTLDGDGQNEPRDIPDLLHALTGPGAPRTLAMVAGERLRRRDNLGKRLASRIANGVRSRLLGDGAADTGCGLKVFWREAYLRTPYFDHNHRYLPALFIREGFEVAFRPVSHRPRLHGRSKYTNLGRLAVAFRDLAGVMWLNRRARSPIAISEVQGDES